MYIISFRQMRGVTLIFLTISACQPVTPKIGIFLLEEELKNSLRISISSVGDTQTYELSQEGELWMATIDQPLGSFAYIELLSHDKELYSGPLSTSDLKHRDFHFEYSSDHGLIPIGQYPQLLTAQLLWGALLIGIFCSLLVRSR